MISRVCLVHYHEIGLKGKNRSRFENQLVVNLQHALSAFPVADITRISGHILVSVTDDSCVHKLAHTASLVPGIARVSLALRTAQREEEFCAAAVQALGEAGEFASFKVHAHRAATNYPLHTLELNRLVGSVLCEAFPSKKVDVHNPDVTVYVNVVQGDVFVYAASLVGVGGLPVGTAGKVVSLLSSGIDSPVATWMVGRRGATVIPIHFSGRPMTADTSEYLCQDIVEKLRPSGIIGRMYVVPFGEVQREISLAVPQGLRIIMYRRMMFQIAERIARIEGAQALVTGESLGQVASQTLENITAVNEAVEIPIFRPLIGTDKQEIIKRAQQIGTFEISSQTAPDCCTLFMPRRPETHARLKEVHAAWEQFDHEACIEKLLNELEYLDVEGCPFYRPPKFMRTYHTTLGPAKSSPVEE
ncbi:MAG: tRNA uracil 4-sulfurtransferase ThiI [Atopobium sp.]|uniref:tRNA uracil 4-sulfurtransferase ThiI n=1 Tax=Atopobium sp. TaxID=1872650 RepID=UPI002A7648D6|nr:tRNA uracil 4-sulfurtransferase ThiI [Atopobium sp.]MDY2787878.1 tRNA uracil 4-sulfurtransferase ThiI [Atopobium sp.]MDY4522537.1 tRNA uracil 4-sulfurtransferase ThiI [Atopobium sp.]